MITGLMLATTYLIEISAENIQGDSDRSDALMAKTRPQVPDAPIVSSVLESEIGSESITVRWQAPSDNGGLITEYMIEWVIDNSDMPSSDARVPSSSRSFDIDSLVSGTTYRIAIRAMNDGGLSNPSSEVLVRTLGVPGVPQNLGVTVTTSDTISVSWNPPSYTGGVLVLITGYEISWTLDSEGNENVTRTFVAVADDPTSNLYIIGSDSALGRLMPGTTYYISVAAMNDIGTGSPSELVSSRTVAIRPSAPQNLSVILNSVTSESFTVNWDEPKSNGGASITEYIISWTDQGTSAFANEDMNGNQRVTAPTTMYTIENLQEGETYSIDGCCRE